LTGKCAAGDKCGDKAIGADGASGVKIGSCESGERVIATLAAKSSGKMR
jgi:hypothetical protein